MRVTTAYKSGDYSCRFYVYDTEKYDSESSRELYNHSDISGYTTKCYLEKGQSAYIKACADEITNEDGNYTINVKLYAEDDTTPRDVYVTGPDYEVIENATVVLYDYERGTDGNDDVYTEVARATSDEDGKVTFNVNIREKSYYVGVIAPEDTDYMSLEEDDYKGINPLTFVGDTSIKLDKMANFNITVTYPNGDPVEGVKVAFGNSYGYDEEASVATNAEGVATIRAQYTSWYVYILDLPEGYEFNKQRLSDTTQTFALQVKPIDLTLTDDSATLSSADAEKRYKVTNSGTGYYTVEATSGYFTSLTVGSSTYVTDGKYVYYSSYANVTTNQD